MWAKVQLQKQKSEHLFNYSGMLRWEKSSIQREIVSIQGLKMGHTGIL